MRDVLNKLIEESDNGAISAQIMLVSGYQFNGAVKKCETGEDTYEALAAMPTQNPQTGQADVKMYRLYFKGEDLRVVAVESPEDAPRIKTPGNGIHIPGRR
jgi:hypothetical protein